MFYYMFRLVSVQVLLSGCILFLQLSKADNNGIDDRGLGGERIVQYSDGNYFFGTWTQSKRNGFGVLQTFDGYKYVGTWSNDNLVGWATVIGAGSTYFGEWMNGQRNGLGFSILTSDISVAGIWKNDWIAGPGILDQGEEATQFEGLVCDRSSTGGGDSDDNWIQEGAVTSCDLIVASSSSRDEGSAEPYKGMLAQIKKKYGMQTAQLEYLEASLSGMAVTAVSAHSHPPNSTSRGYIHSC